MYKLWKLHMVVHLVYGSTIMCAYTTQLAYSVASMPGLNASKIPAYTLINETDTDLRNGTLTVNLSLHLHVNRGNFCLLAMPLDLKIFLS